MAFLFSRAFWAALVLGFAGSLLAAEPGTWKAGTARTIITPTEPLWMSGYASRTKPADGKEMDLWLKALALEDAGGRRAVLISGDVVGFPQTIYQHSCAALKEKFGLEPSQFVLAASHTHCGPVLRKSLYDAYALDATQIAMIEKYSAELEARIVETVGKAIADLASARLGVGQGTAGFAVNRRNNLEPDVPRLIELGSLKGPTDHSVPVLAVYLPDGTLKAVVFGYACHNTVMDYYKWSGDYAGFAQLALEKSHPGVTAMFVMGCGGDQNPLPRHELGLAQRYGNMLASAVEEVLLTPPHTLAPGLRTDLEMPELHLGPAPTPSELEAFKADKPDTKRRWATRLLAETQAGRPFLREYPYPVQAWQLGGEQLLIMLSGEPVVDYALKLKNRFGRRTWVLGYCNDVMAYIPSLRVLKEDVPPLAQARWGYEGSQSMFAYGLPALRWADDVEDIVTTAAARAVERVQSAPQ